MQHVSNSVLHRELSAPFESVEVANQNIQALFKDLQALREKYRIPEFLCLCGANVRAGGGETRKVAICGFGDSTFRLVMLDYALEKERAAIGARLENCLAPKSR